MKMERRDFLGVGVGVLVAGATGSFECFTHLNVVNVEVLCDKMLPKINKGRQGENSEDYAFLIETLHQYEIMSLGDLADLVRENLSAAIKKDRAYAKSIFDGGSALDASKALDSRSHRSSYG